MDKANNPSNFYLALTSTPEAIAMLEHLELKAADSKLIKDSEGRTDPYAMAHAAGWADCVRYMKRLRDHGELARQSA